MSLAGFTYLLAVLPAALLCYSVAPHRYQNRVLLGFSLLFYCWVDLRFGFFLVYCILVTYGAALIIHAAPRPRARRVLVLALVLCLAAMIVPKYGDFFAREIGALFGRPRDEARSLGLLLPVGISFYTFQSLSYLIDVYRGRPPERSLERYALFVAFFPQLVAGPIMRAGELLEQFSQFAGPRPPPRLAWFLEGGYLILKGLFYKVALADRFGEIVAATDIAAQSVSPWRLVLFCFAFSWQVFFDFHGYTTIARGSARWFGIDLARNFYFPFYSHNFADHWNRWHVTLSSWLREYLYFSLGGNRKGRARTYINIMLTMVLGGLWHGAGWNFLLWGALHGAYLVIERMFGLHRVHPRGLRRFAACCLVYTIALPAFGVFAMDAVRDPWPLLRALGDFGAREGLLLVAGVLATVGLSRLAILFEERGFALRWPGALALSVLMGIGLAASGGTVREFIYYKF